MWMAAKLSAIYCVTVRRAWHIAGLRHMQVKDMRTRVIKLNHWDDRNPHRQPTQLTCTMSMLFMIYIQLGDYFSSSFSAYIILKHGNKCYITRLVRAAWCHISTISTHSLYFMYNFFELRVLCRETYCHLSTTTSTCTCTFDKSCVHHETDGLEIFQQGDGLEAYLTWWYQLTGFIFNFRDHPHPFGLPVSSGVLSAL